MTWEIVFHQDFEAWFDQQEEKLQDAMYRHLGLLETMGPMLPRPYADTLKGSRYPHMKELRVQYRGDPWRLLYAFDPKRQAVILLGGCKGGNDRWYVESVPLAEERFDEHLQAIQLIGSKSGGSRK